MDEKRSEDGKKLEKFEILLSTLELRLPLPLPSFCCLGDKEKEVDRGDDLMKTPRSLEPTSVVLQCPPPPRKPRRFPSAAKRKAGGGGGRSILMSHDYFFRDVELDWLFPSNVVGGKIVKKIKGAE
uniref:Uncharacterized protein n=1 Tax=Cucumis sativus TaxID=3659 RepID=A0A0A0KHB1_CUCSA